MQHVGDWECHLQLLKRRGSWISRPCSLSPQLRRTGPLGIWSNASWQLPGFKLLPNAASQIGRVLLTITLGPKNPRSRLVLNIGAEVETCAESKADPEEFALGGSERASGLVRDVLNRENIVQAMAWDTIGKHIVGFRGDQLT